MPLAITRMEMRGGGHGVSAEVAEVASLDEAALTGPRPVRAGSGWRGSGPNRSDGPRERPRLRPEDTGSEMISGWVSILALAVRSIGGGTRVKYMLLICRDE